MVVKRFLSATEGIIGKTVHDPRQEKVGVIKDVFIDPETNQPVFVALAEGGFLGIGRDHVALPWHMLEFNTNSGNVLLAENIKKIQNAPELDLDKLKNSDRDELDKLVGYYGKQDFRNTGGVDQENYKAEEPTEYEHEGYEGSAKITDEAPKNTGDNPADNVDYQKMKGTHG
jgi:hypothetical protein